MKSKILLGALALASVLLFSGCFYTVEDDYYEPEVPLGDTSGEPSYTPYEPPAEELPEVLEPDLPSPPIEPANSSITMDEQQPPENVTWISPGKVMIGNFHAGGRAEYPLTIHNGQDVSVEYLVYYRTPDHVGEGYVKAPSTVQDWVIIADPTPVLAPYETKDIMVVLEMPSDAKDPAPNWEFWVGVKDNSQAGMVQTELCVRWLVQMR